MKILYVDMLYDYGQKKRGLNQIGQLGFKKSLESLSSHIDTFYYDDLLEDKERLQIEIVNYACKVEPDIIFFNLYKDQFYTKTLNKLKKDYTTINWFGDDTWRFDKFSKKYAPCFTYSVTTDKFALKKYKEINTKVILSQWAAIDDDEERKPFIKYEFDITFVGSYHPVRDWYIKEFRKAGLAVATFGPGWENGIVSLSRMKEIFRHSRINLNLSNSNSYDVRYLCSSLKALYYTYRSPKNNAQIKARHFEIPCYGGFQLSEYVPGLDDYFTIGKEITCFKNVNEAIELSYYFLENEKERERLKEQGVESVKNKNSYQKRFEIIFEEIDK